MPKGYNATTQTGREFQVSINAEDSNRIKPSNQGGQKMNERKFITYEEPLKGRTFTEKQMYEVYRDMADKNEYPDFECWFSDMLKSGVFEEV